MTCQLHMAGIFEQRLRAARELRKMSQGDLAEKAGFQPSAISHFETELARIAGVHSTAASDIQSPKERLRTTVGDLEKRGTVTLGRVLGTQDQQVGGKLHQPGGISVPGMPCRITRNKARSSGARRSLG